MPVCIVDTLITPIWAGYVKLVYFQCSFETYALFHHILPFFPLRTTQQPGYFMAQFFMSFCLHYALMNLAVIPHCRIVSVELLHY